MDSDASHGAHDSEPAPGDSIRSLIASFLSYLELRLRLLGSEARETGIQFLVLALLLVSTIIFLAGFVAMLIVFLLYLMMLIFHWEWGWSALALAAMLVVIGIVFELIFTSKIVKPFSLSPLLSFKKIVNGWNTRQKQRITEALDRVRIQVQDRMLLLWRKLNVGRHILKSIRCHPWEWTSLAAGFGWLLSRLPARKKKIYIYTNQE